MRAIVVTAHGGPDVLVLRDAQAPRPGKGELLVDVVAAGVNYMDVYLRTGQPPYDAELPVVPGSEGAGTVAALGAGVEGFAVGDEVAWASAPGSYAEQVVVPAQGAVKVPEGVGLEVAAAVMLQGMTAHFLATSAFPLSQGDACVVHAAAGGVGLLLVQIAKRRLATVIATTSSPEKASLAEQAGADHLCSYDDFVEVTRRVTGEMGAAAVYDGVGAATFDDSLRALRRRGYLVCYGAASGPVPPIDVRRLRAGGSLFLTRPYLGDYVATRAELESRCGDLFNWIRHGELSVRIERTYPLAEAQQAHSDLESRSTAGKLLLTTR